MSDIGIELSPGSEKGSEHSDDENPPTPGSYKDFKDGENSEDINIENENNEKEVTASDEVIAQESDSSDKEDSQAEEKQSVVSPISPISPISPNNQAADDGGGSDMEIDEDEENIELPNDDAHQMENDKEVLEDKDRSEGSPSSPKAYDENSNDMAKEETGQDIEQGKKIESSDKRETSDDNRGESHPETVVSQDDDNESEQTKEDVSSSKNNSRNVEDADLLNITEISDLSVDLTGDEAAIVEDILQNDDDGELLSHSGGKTDVTEEKPADQEEISGSHEEKSRKLSKDNDDDNEEQPGGTGELINDIFGSSDEDDEDFAGFEDDELHGTTKIKKKSKLKQEKKGAIVSDDEDEGPKPVTESQTEDKTHEEESLTVPPPEDSDDEDNESSEIFVSDFDRMMAQKKEENRKAHRRRKNVDIINDNDDLVVGIIKKMKEAAQEDKLANEARQAATKKLKLLPTVLKHMLKVDLMIIFVDSNVLPVLKEWISPLPDGSLPHIQIREAVLKILEQLPPMDSGALKVSGIGRAVMYLFRHPKESRKNKQRAGKIISEWSRPIFGVTANFKSMTREEREERDYVNMSKRRRLSNDGVDGGRTPKRIENAIKSESKALRPGDKGWCMRARVPVPSNKDYVVRPKSNIDFVDFTKTPKKALNRFEKQKRKFKDQKAGTKQRAVEISLEGRKMAL